MVCAYIGSGLQLFIIGAVIAWMPSYLNRYYGLRPGQGGRRRGFVLLGVGMIACGIVTDRLSKKRRQPQVDGRAVFTAISFVLLSHRLRPDAGTLQLVLSRSARSSPAAPPARPARWSPTSPRRRSTRTAFATLTLANNLLGLAAGPLVTGAIADKVGLVDAMKFAPLVSVLAIIALLIGRRAYPASLRRVNTAASA